LTNPTIDKKFTNVISGDVYIGKHVIIGSGTIVLPNVKINDYSSVGALSLINKDVDELKIVAGVPAKEIKNRNKNLIKLENDFLNYIKK
jgi:galactoside O-acetyltransferase